MSDYTAPKYEPSIHVKATHGIYHVNPMTGQIVDGSFPSSVDLATARDYVMSVATIPVAILIIGIIAILMLFLISNCCAPGTIFWKYIWYYVCCCFCCPPKPKQDVDLEKKKNAWYDAQKKAVRWCFSVLTLLSSCAGFVWYGDADITKGMDGINKAIGLLRGTIENIFGSINNMFTGADNVSAAFKPNGACTYSYLESDPTWGGITNSITGAIDNLNGAGDQIDKLSLPIFDGLDMLRNNIDTAKPQKDNIVLWVFLGCLGLVFLNFLTIWRKNAYISFGVSIINYVLMIVLLLVCSVVMIVVMIIADFCMDPTGAILAVAGGAADTVRYYTTCVGTNKFGESLTVLDQALATLSTFVGEDPGAGNRPALPAPPTNIFVPPAPQDIWTVEYYAAELLVPDPNNLGAFTTACLSDCYSCSTALQTEIEGIQNEVGDIVSMLGCEGINPFYDQLINQAFCTDSFSGVYKLWGDFYFMALFIFVLLCCISKLYQYMISDDDAKRQEPWKKKHYQTYQKTANSEESAAMNNIEGGGNNSDAMPGAGVEMTNVGQGDGGDVERGNHANANGQGASNGGVVYVGVVNEM